MPKKVFWPAVLVIMGLIVLASNLQMLPPEFWNIWPMILIIVGLGGLLLSDRDEWLSTDSKSSVRHTSKKTKKSSRRKK